MGTLTSAAEVLPAGPWAGGPNSRGRPLADARIASDVVAGFALGAVLERFLRSWTDHPIEASKEYDHADA
jgi:undecaprenyl-diphosphatase